MKKLISLITIFFVLISINAFAAVITPVNPASNQNLLCAMPGEDPTIHKYEWFLNNALTQYNTNTLPFAATSHYQNWLCRISIPATAFMQQIQLGEATATIANTPHTVTIGGALSAVEGTSVSFTGSAIDAVDNDAVSSWIWNFGDSTAANVQNPSKTYSQQGTYAVTLTAADAYNVAGTNTAAITITDTAPTASLAVTTTLPVNEGDTVSFAATANAYDVPITASWNFGDGNTGTGLTPSNTYQDNSNYNVVLTVRDNDGSVVTRNTNVQVLNVNPTANANGPYSCNEGSNVTLAGTAADPGADTLTFDWNLDGDLTYEVLDQQNTIFTCTADGSYVVNLRVTDDDGGINKNETNVTVNDLAPIADFNVSNNTVLIGETINFTDLSTSVVDSIVSWAYSFGDGNNATVQNPNYAYSADGIFDVTLTVNDSDGSVSVSPITQITVNAIPSTCNAPANGTWTLTGSDYEYCEGVTLNLDSILLYDDSVLILKNSDVTINSGTGLWDNSSLTLENSSITNIISTPTFATFTLINSSAEDIYTYQTATINFVDSNIIALNSKLTASTTISNVNNGIATTATIGNISLTNTVVGEYELDLRFGDHNIDNSNISFLETLDSMGDLIILNSTFDYVVFEDTNASNNPTISITDSFIDSFDIVVEGDLSFSGVSDGVTATQVIGNASFVNTFVNYIGVEVYDGNLDITNSNFDYIDIYNSTATISGSDIADIYQDETYSDISDSVISLLYISELSYSDVSNTTISDLILGDYGNSTANFTSSYLSNRLNLDELDLGETQYIFGSLNISPSATIYIEETDYFGTLIRHYPVYVYNSTGLADGIEVNITNSTDVLFSGLTVNGYLEPSLVFNNETYANVYDIYADGNATGTIDLLTSTPIIINISTAAPPVIPPGMNTSGNVVINEIMYNPLPTTMEWIEIFNLEPFAINLSNWNLFENSNKTLAVNTVDYIAANDYAVITDDAVAFLANFTGFTGTLFEVSALGLSNTGEMLKLYNATGDLIDEVNYVSAWGGASNYSLELINASLDNNNGTNWQTSFVARGTPGAVNSLLTPSCVVPTDGMVITQNTTFCPGTYNLLNGIEVGSNDVILDCNGTKLNGTNTSNNGININGVHDITVKNCQVVGYYIGIYLFYSDNSIITNNNINSNNIRGIELAYSNNSIIHSNDIFNNNKGIRPVYSNNNLISNNNVFNNNDGIDLSYSINNIITNNTVNLNNDRGIGLLNSVGNNTITNNNVSDNNYGLTLMSSLGNDTIFNNNFFNNINYDLQYSGQSNNMTAPSNYWGTINMTEIQNRIYDYYDDNSSGIVDFCPYLDAPYPFGNPVACGGVNLPPQITLSTPTSPLTVNITTGTDFNVTVEDPEGLNMTVIWTFESVPIQTDNDIMNGSMVNLNTGFDLGTYVLGATVYDDISQIDHVNWTVTAVNGTAPTYSVDLACDTYLTAYPYDNNPKNLANFFCTVDNTGTSDNENYTVNVINLDSADYLNASPTTINNLDAGVGTFLSVSIGDYDVGFYDVSVTVIDEDRSWVNDTINLTLEVIPPPNVTLNNPVNGSTINTNSTILDITNYDNAVCRFELDPSQETGEIRFYTSGSDDADLMVDSIDENATNTIDIPYYYNSSDILFGLGPDPDEEYFVDGGTCSPSTKDATDCEGVTALGVTATGEAHVFEIVNIDFGTSKNETDIKDLTYDRTYSDIEFTTGVNSLLSLGSFGSITVLINEENVTFVDTNSYKPRTFKGKFGSEIELISPTEIKINSPVDSIYLESYYDPMYGQIVFNESLLDDAIVTGIYGGTGYTSYGAYINHNSDPTSKVNIEYPPSSIRYRDTFNVTDYTYQLTNLSEGQHDISLICDGYPRDYVFFVDTTIPNNIPEITEIGAVNVSEGSLLTFIFNATDIDGDPITITTSALPPGATYISEVFSWTPTYTQSGIYQVTFNVTDGYYNVSEIATITVYNVPQNGTVAGFIFEQDGITPISNAGVELKNEALTIASGTTNGAGAYTISVQPGTYDVLAFAINHIDNLNTSAVVVTELNITDYNVSLLPVITIGDISGTITDGTNNIYEATVQLRQGVAVINSLVTDETGAYSFIGEDVGLYNLTVVKAGFNGYIQSVTITAGSSATQDVTLIPAVTSGVMMGSVRNATNDLIPTVTNITIKKSTGGTVQIVQTDGTGNYTINGLPATVGFTYEITADVISPPYSSVFGQSGIALTQSPPPLTGIDIYMI